MDGNEQGVSIASKFVYFLSNSQNFLKTVSIVSFIALIISFLVNFYWGIIIVFHFSLGCFLGHYAVRHEDKFFQWSKKFRDGICLNTPCADALKSDQQSLSLNSNQPNISNTKLNAKPWAELRIPPEVDEAIEEILNLLLERHIYPWYSQLSTDDAFVQEIRISLRFIFSSLLQRALKLRLVPLLMENAVSILFQHLEVYLESKKNSKTQRDVEMSFLRFLGNEKMHPALKNRQSELQYLRQLTENLLPFIVQKKYLECRSATSLVREIFCNLVFLPVMDIIADPDIVNHLLVLFFDKTPMAKYPDSNIPNVEFLSNFIESHATNEKSLLHTSLQSILENQSILYLYMSFLKEEGAINILQFLLSVDDFNSVILNPELSTTDIQTIHERAKKLFSTYFDPKAADCLKFDESILNEIQEIISGPSENVIKLRTTTPLFRAYDHAYTMLEKIYCPMFFQSEKYFHLICGERCSATVNKSSNRSNKKGGAGISAGISKLGIKIKGVFTTTIDDGQMFEEESGTDLAEALFADIDIQPDSYGNEDMYRMENDPRLKKLSAWRVFIPHVVTGMDQNCKYYHAYHIEVQRIDVRDNDKPEDLHWKLERRYNEFYILEAKLIEFHGELTVHLPAKRSQQKQGKQFLESRRLEFEKFLQTLLTLPSLQGSELLYKFLRTPIPFTSSFLPDIKLGKMIKTVPRKLIKEKGQNLLPFLQAFLASTEAAKPKPSKLDWNQIQDMSTAWSSDKLTDCLFGNNYEGLKSTHSSNGTTMTSTSTVVYLREIYDYIHYIMLEVVFRSSPRASRWARVFLQSCDIILRYPVQALTEWYLDYKLREALKPQRLAEVLNLLRDVLFFDDDPPRTRHQKNERAALALEQAKEYFPAIVRTQSLEDSLKLLFEALQCPLLNKQLSYVMLDNLALELFPEFKEI